MAGTLSGPGTAPPGMIQRDQQTARSNPWRCTAGSGARPRRCRSRGHLGTTLNQTHPAATTRRCLVRTCAPSQACPSRRGSEGLVFFLAGCRGQNRCFPAKQSSASVGNGLVRRNRPRVPSGEGRAIGGVAVTLAHRSGLGEPRVRSSQSRIAWLTTQRFCISQ